MARMHADSKPATGGGKRIRIRQVRSPIGFRFNQRQILFGRGLSRPGHVVELEDTPSIRGMITKVNHLVVIEEGK